MLNIEMAAILILSESDLQGVRRFRQYRRRVLNLKKAPAGFRLPGAVLAAVILMPAAGWAGGHRALVMNLRERTERERREVVDRHHDDDDADEHAGEKRFVGGECSGRVGNGALPGETAGQAEHEDDRKEPAE